MTTPILRIENVSKSFSGLTAVSNVSFEVPEGSIVGLIGPNGAGKTTLFNVVTARLSPSAGIVRFKEDRITGLFPHRIARLGIASTFQNVRLFTDQTAFENVAIGGFRHASTGFFSGLVGSPSATRERRAVEDLAHECLDFVGLKHLAKVRSADLPFGQQRLLEFARALALKPALLLLDEPAAGLNDRETQFLSHLISQLPAKGITTLLVEHNIDLIMSVAHKIVVLNNGIKIADGEPRSVRENEAVIDAYFGVRQP